VHVDHNKQGNMRPLCVRTRRRDCYKQKEQIRPYPGRERKIAAAAAATATIL